MEIAERRQPRGVGQRRSRGAVSTIQRDRRDTFFAHCMPVDRPGHGGSRPPGSLGPTSGVSEEELPATLSAVQSRNREGR